jgi:hypothetical protein
MKHLLVSVVLVWATLARAEEPEAIPWTIPWSETAPGAMDASHLLDAPAGKDGVIEAREGHFFAGNERIRFWGVNVCFEGAFPTHADADAVADRLARFGFNAVRFHHMDSAPFPRGIFADASVETLSPEALDRLCYFIDALAKRGIYSNLNLHVSRDYARAKKWENADKLPGYDKIVDLFYPPLIEANRQYARDLLTHVNPYRKRRLADDPAVAMLEINNENSLFMWGAADTIASLPEPYATELRWQWNAWLKAKYKDRPTLAKAWGVGVAGESTNLIRDAGCETVGKPGSPWVIEQHPGAKMRVRNDFDKSGNDIGVVITVEQITGTDWHLQFNQPGLRLRKGEAYVLKFSARSKPALSIGVAVGQAHEPWQNLGLSRGIELTPQPKEFSLTFVATADEENARFSFALGGAKGEVTLIPKELMTTALEGLRAGEDFDDNTVQIQTPDRVATLERRADWLDFLQQTEERHYVEMRRFLRDELGVKAPITGTIGFGPLQTMGQARLDFVDAHAYWDHPRFPGRPWDPGNWLIHNRPMVDAPDRATLWRLAATRVAGKPFTVTEYNHAAPNEWQSECVPMIAAFAAAQDWDAVFLFAYSHNAEWRKGRISSFFDIEGNPAHMALAPLGARIFLGGLLPPKPWPVPRGERSELLRIADMQRMDDWGYLANERGVKWTELLGDLNWTANGEGTGQFSISTDRAAVFAGFPPAEKPIALGPAELRDVASPFVSAMLVPAGEDDRRLFLAAVGRVRNTGMQWDNNRQTVGRHWGRPPALAEALRATLRIQANARLYPLDPRGQRQAELPATAIDGASEFKLEGTTLWYEIEIGR